MIKSFRSKALAELFETGRTTKLNVKLHKRIIVRLDTLNDALSIADLALAGYNFQALRGFTSTRYTIHVNGPWCLTFEFVGGDALHVDFEYHEGNCMVVYEAKRDPNRCPSHPGEVLDDILPDLGRSKAEIARLLGISRQMLYDITAGRKPVSPTVAAKLGKLVGNGPAIWLRMQAAHDAWHAEREVDVSSIPTIRAA